MKRKNDTQLLEEIKALLVLIAAKSGAKYDEIGKCLDVTGKQVGNILSGYIKQKKKGKKDEWRRNPKRN